MMMFCSGVSVGFMLGMVVLLVKTKKQAEENTKKFIRRLERRHVKG